MDLNVTLGHRQRTDEGVYLAGMQFRGDILANIQIYLKRNIKSPKLTAEASTSTQGQ